MTETVVLLNLDQTADFAKKLTSEVKPNKFFLLSGELGAGKTTFTKALLKAFGVEENVSSPTFILMNQYEVNGLTINHIDGYRLTKKDDIGMLEEQFDDAFNIIEWYENLNFDFEQVDYLKLNFKKNDDGSRQVEIFKKD